MRLCNLRCVALNYAEDCERAELLLQSGPSLCAPKIGEILSSQNIWPKTNRCSSFPPLLAHAAYTQSSQFFFDSPAQREKEREQGGDWKETADSWRATNYQLPEFAWAPTRQEITSSHISHMLCRRIFARAPPFPPPFLCNPSLPQLWQVIWPKNRRANPLAGSTQ